MADESNTPEAEERVEQIVDPVSQAVSGESLILACKLENKTDHVSSFG